MRDLCLCVTALPLIFLLRLALDIVFFVWRHNFQREGMRSYGFCIIDSRTFIHINDPLWNGFRLQQKGKKQI